MENQHRHIRGYRELSEEEISLMNQIKQKGVELEQLIYQVQATNRYQAPEPSAQRPVFGTEEEQNAMMLYRETNRWIELARSQLQQGMMALTRAVAKPTSF